MAGIEKLITVTAGAELVKVLAAANATNLTLTAERAPPGSLPHGALIGLVVSGTTISGANAIVRFLSFGNKKLVPAAHALAIDQWIEWEANHLHDDATLPASLIALEAIIPEFHLVNNQVTLADFVLGATLAELKEKHEAAFEPFARINAYIANGAAIAPLSAAAEASQATAEVLAAAVPKLEVLEAGPTDATIQVLDTLFIHAIMAAFPSIDVAPLVGSAANPAPSSKFAHHYQCNLSMKICNLLGETGKAGRRVAQAIIDNFPASPMVAKLDVAGPGFVNVYMSPSYLEGRVNNVVAAGVLAPKQPAVRNAIVDYSSPNIAKDMHVGHLRSTIIGDAISRFLEFAGHNVTRINHVGDWGTQFGMLIAYLKREFPGCADGSKTLPDSMQDLTVLYKQAKLVFDEDEQFKKDAHDEVVKLQAGDEVNINLWKSLVSKSAEMFNQVYKRLGVSPKLKLMGESFYNPLIPACVAELEKAGLTKVDNGATIMFTPDSEVPLMVRKSDGGYGYDSTDLTAIKYRLQEMKGDWLIYVVDAGQSLHFDLVFRGAQMAGWYDPAKVRVEHVAFGVVQGKDRKRLRTRAGQSTRLEDLLDTARDKEAEELKKRADGQVMDVAATAEELGYGSVKYFDLRQHRLTDYVFDYDRMLSPQGDTAVYMQYMHARICSIIVKAGQDPNVEPAEPVPANLAHKSEVALAVDIVRFQEMINQVLDGLCPHHLCGYMLTLSSHFSDFFRDCKVVGDPAQESRLTLCRAVMKVMRQCMALLGMKPLERI